MSNDQDASYQEGQIIFDLLQHQNKIESGNHSFDPKDKPEVLTRKKMNMATHIQNLYDHHPPTNNENIMKLVDWND